MNYIEQVRDKVKKLYAENPVVHVNVNISKQKIHLSNVKAKIVGVYSNIFQLEDLSNTLKRKYTLQYNDIILKQIEILELGQ